MEKLKYFFDLFYKTLSNNPNYRIGQCYFNVLWEIDPELANEIRGTEVDPFYLDKKIPDFLETLAKKWENK